MKILQLLSLLLLSTIASAQIAWERPYGGSTKPIMTDIIQGPGNTYYVCGSDTVNSNVRAVLTKLDSLGNTLWEKYYTVQDSDFYFDNLLLQGNEIIVQSASLAHVNGYYSVPKTLRMDTTGAVIDSVYPSIAGVYNQTANMGLDAGANGTFWASTYIGTFGISNAFNITRRDQNLDELHTNSNSCFYEFKNSFNKKGEYMHDVWTDEYDTVTHIFSNPDHITLYDTAGFATFDTTYFTLDRAKGILRTEDGGFSLFYSYSDSLVIRHFNSAGIQQSLKSIYQPVSFLINLVPAADSGYFASIGNTDVSTYQVFHTIYKFSNSDDMLWSQVFTKPYVKPSQNQRTHPTEDGGAIALFSTNLFGDSTNYIVKLGPNGERFPFTLQTSPTLHCIGDTVQITTLEPAASYSWNTGDTSAVLTVTASGNYGGTVIDSLGTTHTIHPIYIQFDSIPQFTLNDAHTCQSGITLNQTNPGNYTFFTNDLINFQFSSAYFAAMNTPDTMQIWEYVFTPGGCRSIDSALVYFDDCTEVPILNLKNDFFSVQNTNSSIIVRSENNSPIVQLDVLDLSGRMIQIFTGNSGTIEFNTSILSNGIYFIKCLIDGRVSVKKIIVSH